MRSIHVHPHGRVWTWGLPETYEHGVHCSSEQKNQEPGIKGSQSHFLHQLQHLQLFMNYDIMISYNIRIPSSSRYPTNVARRTSWIAPVPWASPRTSSRTKPSGHRMQTAQGPNGQRHAVEARRPGQATGPTGTGLEVRGEHMVEHGWNSVRFIWVNTQTASDFTHWW